MMFSDRMDLKLIKLVEENPVLYNHNHVNYMDFNTREVTWQRIGDEMKRPAADCKIRWINIRDVYRRILKKNLEQRDPNRRTKAYKYEKALLFMRNFYKDVLAPNDFESDDRNDDDQGEAEPCNDLDIAESEEEVKPLRKISKRTNKKVNRRRKKKDYDEYEEPERPVNSLNIVESVAPQQDFDTSDPVDAFLLSIGASLKSFTPYHLNLAKSEIFAVVQEHELQQIVQKGRKDITTHDVKVSTSDPMFLS